VLIEPGIPSLVNVFQIHARSAKKVRLTGKNDEAQMTDDEGMTNDASEAGVLIKHPESENSKNVHDYKGMGLRYLLTARGTSAGIAA
jgi:hypothetical protein